LPYGKFKHKEDQHECRYPGRAIEGDQRGANRRGKLTDDDLTRVEGKEEQPLGLLQKRYGYAKEKANQEFKELIVCYGKPPLGEKIK
jgi:hypothetical protein